MAKRWKGPGRELFDPKKLEKIAEQLCREGRMPSLEEFLDAIAEIREEMLASRRTPKKDSYGKPRVN
jgi:hypothetical protein